MKNCFVRLLSLSLILLLFVFVLGACGGGEGEVKEYNVAVGYPEGVIIKGDNPATVKHGESVTFEVVIPEELKYGLSDEYIKALISILSGDPRPQYKEDGDRIYGMIYGKYEVKFTVADGVLTVVEILKA